jgi:hypothetical protein
MSPLRHTRNHYVIPVQTGIQNKRSAFSLLKCFLEKETTKMFLRKNGFLINSRHEKMDSRLRGNDEKNENDTSPSVIPA